MKVFQSILVGAAFADPILYDIKIGIQIIKIFLGLHCKRQNYQEIMVPICIENMV